MNFKEFLETSLTESTGLSKTINDVKKILDNNNIDYSEYNNSIDIGLPNDAKDIPSNLSKIIDKCIKIADGKMLLAKTAVGYSMGNSVKFVFPAKKAAGASAFHVTFKSNVDDILKHGLKPQNAKEHSNMFKQSLGDVNHKQVYEAVFLIKNKGAVNKVIKMFNMKDVVVLKVNIKGMEVWEDPLMPDQVKSLLTYENIPADKITIDE